jgi:hypothetical protein
LDLLGKVCQGQTLSRERIVSYKEEFYNVGVGSAALYELSLAIKLKKVLRHLFKMGFAPLLSKI